MSSGEMTRYGIVFKPSAEKEFLDLPGDVQRRIDRKLQSLRDAPRGCGAIKLKCGEDFYRVRVGDYRVIYQIDDARRIIIVAAVGNRRDIYRDF